MNEVLKNYNFKGILRHASATPILLPNIDAPESNGQLFSKVSNEFD